MSLFKSPFLSLSQPSLSHACCWGRFRTVERKKKKKENETETDIRSAAAAATLLNPLLSYFLSYSVAASCMHVQLSERICLLVCLNVLRTGRFA